MRRISVSLRDGKAILVHNKHGRRLLIQTGEKEVEKLHDLSNFICYENFADIYDCLLCSGVHVLNFTAASLHCSFIYNDE